MLEKVHTLSSIGLFENGVPKPATFDKVTLIYAENGRGKSTLTTVLRAATEGDIAAIRARKTLDLATAPKVGFLVGGTPTVFEGDAWTGTRPEFLLFDGEFVDRNVYSGTEVRPDQRQALLDFALGDAAVALKRDVEKITADSVEAAKQKSLIETQLSAYRKDLTLEAFKQLPLDPDTDAKIEKLKVSIALARQQEGILKRPEPSNLPLLAPDLTAFFQILETSIAGVEAAAEEKVRAHLATQKHRGFENWISQGQQFMEGDACPFCAQSTRDLDLIRAYRTHFNKAYADLKAQVGSLMPGLEREIPAAASSRLARELQTNEERVSAWDSEIRQPHPTLDMTVLAEHLRAIQEALFRLAKTKQESPLETVSTTEVRAEIQRRLDEANALIRTYNDSIEGSRAAISGFKRDLAATDSRELDKQVASLELQKVRHTEKVVKAFSDLDQLDALRKQLEEDKASARQKLDALMENTLATFGTDINTWLTTFGASFSIEEMKPDYQGAGLPRTKYGLKIRSQVVSLSSRDAGTPSFRTTLSEGDKRTLAFAFFLSHLFKRQDRGDLVVVVDDPVSSLDKNRRTRTKEALSKVATECKQLLVLAHDAHFLRDLGVLSLKLGMAVKTLEIRRAANEYSVIAECDLNPICASEYSRQYSLVHDFVAASPGFDARAAAKALRLLIEGHLHRRFPRHIPTGAMLGEVITHLRDSQPPSPLVALKSKVPELRSLNDYATRFHHSNPSAETEPLVEAELLTYCKQALELIHTGMP